MIRLAPRGAVAPSGGVRPRTAGGGPDSLRIMTSVTEPGLLRFRTRAGLDAAVRDPDRLAHRERLGDAVPTTRVLEVRDVPPPSG